VRQHDRIAALPVHRCGPDASEHGTGPPPSQSGTGASGPAES
jgi:hypothetical protein